jgi:hypothetical protein
MKSEGQSVCPAPPKNRSEGRLAIPRTKATLQLDPDRHSSRKNIVSAPGVHKQTVAKIEAPESVVGSPGSLSDFLREFFDNR